MNFDKLLAGWTFRTSTPDYAVGDELTVFVTGTNGSTPIVRIGDTVISLLDVEDGRPLVDRRVRIRVTEFDTQRHEGSGELLSVFDEEE
ncbi:hypothetical protein SAMN04487948_105125 [Halogranum amylolyticum]|uniref:DUF7513 domain-containing protein n=1 Tax=Halogranum amylolyticum TaxID=660520 RepID=A0A1H8SIK6_9EURY|nr:hypothetical protein [Halogranum amylolyticum]SEO78502.1 hypothetical protein SAMN04487948_105125 [Halogranum amylolyticum]